MRKIIILSVGFVFVLGSLTLATPKYIAKEKIMETMMDFNKSLGVKCSACHVTDKSVTLEDVGKYDPAKDTDALTHRAVAAGMMASTAMTNKILKKTGADQLTCMTCHKGSEHPTL
ncbi:MAG: photosynthetic reaction center cytochrome c subunit family protein [Candidatus Margulisiibacteriota bacterium]